jgi:methionyl-tRNA synthetase
MKFYVTTAIDYINARPHIGHALEKIGADVLARYRRLHGDDVFFLTGVDEHSLNVQRQAEKEGKTPREYCNGMVGFFTDAWAELGISCDHFIRTTDESHEKAVAEFFKKLHERGHLYLGDYEGLYCPSCENFYTEKEAVNGNCPTHQRPLEAVREKNYYFRLSAFEKSLRELIERGEFRIEPEPRRNEILGLLHEGLQDISFTRQKVTWGVPCPIQPDQTIWIWLDALLNYVSGVGWPHDMKKFERFWPADVHIIGKDITRFHCVIWPAVLLAADLPLPKTVFAHGFISVEGEKMSKTRGNVVEPADVLKKYPADVLRYYLMREVPFHGDGDFSWARLEQRYQTDLANDLGNLLQRTLSMIQRYCDGKISGPATQTPLVDARKFAEAMDALAFNVALTELWQAVTRCNQYVEEKAPWKLAKDAAKARELAAVLYNLAESCRIISVLLAPFMPETSEKMRVQLGLPVKFGRFADEVQWGCLPAGQAIGAITPLFPKNS